MTWWTTRTYCRLDRRRKWRDRCARHTRGRGARGSKRGGAGRSAYFWGRSARAPRRGPGRIARMDRFGPGRQALHEEEDRRNFRRLGFVVGWSAWDRSWRRRKRSRHARCRLWFATRFRRRGLSPFSRARRSREEVLRCRESISRWVNERRLWCIGELGQVGRYDARARRMRRATWVNGETRGIWGESGTRGHARARHRLRFGFCLRCRKRIVFRVHSRAPCPSRQLPRGLA